MSQPLVLAIEPDLRQAAIVKRIVRENALADVVVVDSRDAAIEAMRTSMPDVLLLSALLSPRDEDELMAHLRTLDNAAHLQTHTIPQLASTLGPGEERSRGLFSGFLRKKDAPVVVAGCDPEMFADEIRAYLQRAAERKRLQQTQDFVAHDMRRSATARTAAAAAAPDHEEPAGAAAESSSWASPFEWKPTSRKKSTKTQAPSAPAAPPASAPAPVVMPAPPASEVAPGVAAAVESLIAPKPVEEPAPAMAIAAEPAAQEPISVILPKDADTPPPSSTLHAAAHIDTVAPEPPPAITKAKPVDAPRPKPVAERGPKLTGRIQIQDLLKANLPKDTNGRDRLGSLARWARADAPRTNKGAAVTSEDVRALISSLAVPSTVASVTYPRGCRIRRVRVPAHPEQPAA